MERDIFIKQFHFISRLGKDYIYEDKTLSIAEIPKGISISRIKRFLTRKESLTNSNKAIYEFFKTAWPRSIRRRATDDAAAISPEISKLVLVVANMCNMNCAYCDTDRGRYRQQEHERNLLMRADVAIKAIDFFFENICTSEDVSISFFGGEPLLNWDVIEKSVEHGEKRAKSRGLNIFFNISTNGTVFKPRIVDFLKSRENIGGLISIDSDRAMEHDRLRRYADGNGTFKSIEETLRKYPIIKERFSPRLTVTRWNTNLLRYSKYFKSIGFHDSHYFPVASPDPGLTLNNIDMNKLDVELEKLLRWDISQTKKTGIRNTYGFTKWLSIIEDGVPRLICRGGHKFITIAHDGSIYPCHHVVYDSRFRLGDLRNGIDAGRHEKLLCKYRASNNPRCESCFAMNLCGGCYYLEDLYDKRLIPSIELFCRWQRSVFENALVLHNTIKNMNK